MIEGDLPNRELQLVKKWASEHKDELRTMWEEKRVIKLPPLKK